MSRRDLLGTIGKGAVVLGAGGLMAACSGSSTPSTTTTGTTSPPSSSVTTTSGASTGPKRGGTLRAALGGGSSSDTLDALAPIQSTDFARTLNLFEQLTIYGPTGAVENLLAEEVTPNAKATSWTIRLRPDITWHNGKPLTAEDVIYTFQQITNSKSPAPGAPLLARIDVANMKKLDALTVQVPCHTPYSTLRDAIAGWYFNVIPVGYDPKVPIGTGPFKASKFTPGEDSVFVRNDNYWQTGLPYLDSLVITDFATETAQINALLSGEADVVDVLSAASIAAVHGGGAQILLSKTSGFTPLYMRRDAAPFKDVRVSQAMRLVCDREEMLKLIFGGNGLLGNDIYGYADPAYDHQIPQRVQDIDKAKSLLRQAGQENLQVTLTAAPIAQGTVQLAQVFAEQASQAGIKVNVDLTTPGVEFGPNYAKFLFAQDYVIYTTYLTQIALSGLPSSPFPETHFNDPHYTDLFNQALATVDTTARYEIEHEMMLIDWNQNGSIIPYFYPTIDGYTSHVHGVHTSVTGWPLGGYDFKSMWLS
jgi:peptide/nickel transport system substrate-binding protein